MEVETLRGLERLFIILIGGMSIGAGWHLFIRGVVGNTDGSFKGKGWEFTLQRAGPGLFFALFGAAICINSTLNPLNITTPGKPNANDESNSDSGPISTLSYLGSGDGEGYRLRYIQAINTLELIDQERAADYASHQQAIAEAIDILRTSNERYVQAFLSEKLISYRAAKQKMPTQRTAQERSIVDDVERYYQNLLPIHQ